jgi:hypothetical protein
MARLQLRVVVDHRHLGDQEGVPAAFGWARRRGRGADSAGGGRDDLNTPATDPCPRHAFAATITTIAVHQLFSNMFSVLLLPFSRPFRVGGMIRFGVHAKDDCERGRTL